MWVGRGGERVAYRAVLIPVVHVMPTAPDARSPINSFPQAQQELEALRAQLAATASATAAEGAAASGAAAEAAGAGSGRGGALSEEEAALIRSELKARAWQCDELRAECEELRAQCDEARAECEELRAKCEELGRELAAAKAGPEAGPGAAAAKNAAGVAAEGEAAPGVDQQQRGGAEEGEGDGWGDLMIEVVPPSASASAAAATAGSEGGAVPAGAERALSDNPVFYDAGSNEEQEGAEGASARQGPSGVAMVPAAEVDALRAALGAAQQVRVTLCVPWGFFYWRRPSCCQQPAWLGCVLEGPCMPFHPVNLLSLAWPFLPCAPSDLQLPRAPTLPQGAGAAAAGGSSQRSSSGSRTRRAPVAQCLLLSALHPSGTGRGGEPRQPQPQRQHGKPGGCRGCNSLRDPVLLRQGQEGQGEEGQGRGQGLPCPRTCCGSPRPCHHLRCVRASCCTRASCGWQQRPGGGGSAQPAAGSCQGRGGRAESAAAGQL